jgi:hypothetical protein
LLKFEKKQYWAVGLIFTMISFIILFASVKLVLGNDVNLKNIMFYGGFSLLVGATSAIMVFWRFKIAFWCFTVGVVFGFFQMYRSFLNGMSGWGDLVGVLSLLTLIIIGLGTGIIAQFGYYLYKRNH